MQDLKQIVAEKKEQEIQEKRRKAGNDQFKVDLAEVLRTAGGRRVMKRLLGMETMPRCVTEPYRDAFTLGRLSVITEIKSYLTTEQIRAVEDEK